jgi:hypothetical protein
MITYIIVLILLALSIANIIITSAIDTDLKKQNNNVMILSWIISSIGLLFVVSAFTPATPSFVLKKYMIIIGLLLLSIGITGLFFAYKNYTEENKADVFNKISYSLSAITFFAIGNLSPKLI